MPMHNQQSGAAQWYDSYILWLFKKRTKNNGDVELTLSQKNSLKSDIYMTAIPT